MTDFAKKIDSILSVIKNVQVSDPLKTSGSERVYTDERILTSASRLSFDVPEKYSEMRRLAASAEGLSLSESALFVRQGRFMADFEDDYYDQAFFMRYYPTYRQMSDRQLRTYFTWRSAVRRGEIKPTHLSYVYVYIYELINLIGCTSPEEAREKLVSFVNAYSELDPSVKGLPLRWANDMSVYYGIPEATDAEIPRDSHIQKFSDPASCTDDEFFAALCALSSYDPSRSKLYKKHPEEYKTLMRRVFASFTELCRTSRKLTLTERLFGRYALRRYILFPSAVFYDARRREGREYVGRSGERYVFKDGACFVEGYPEQRKKSTALASLVKTADSLLRPYFGMEATKPGGTVATLGAIVKKETDAYFEEQRRAAAKKIEIDYTLLGGIRASADKTRDLLVTEDEIEPEEVPEPLVYAAEEKDGGGTEPAVALTDAEKEILRLILAGGDAAGYARAAGLPLSVAVDSINEKLFDEFFDTAIEFDGDAPVPVADYEDELRGIAG